VLDFNKQTTGNMCWSYFRPLKEDTLKFTLESRYILLVKVLPSPLPPEIHIYTFGESRPPLPRRKSDDV